MQSPAPTVLTTVVGGGGAYQAPSASTSTAPSAAQGGQHRADAAVDQGARGLGGHAGVGLERPASVPVTEASSSAFGLSRSGAASGSRSTSAASGPSLVSTATRLTARSRGTSSA